MAMGLGKKASAMLYGFEMLFPYIWVAILSILGYMPVGTVAIFLTLPIAIACAKTMKNAVIGGMTLIADLDVRTANLQLQFSALLAASFIITRVIAICFC
jgi:1,4-dihydroxy-2-naphthoate octaprenyltransferase